MDFPTQLNSFQRLVVRNRYVLRACVFVCLCCHLGMYKRCRMNRAHYRSSLVVSWTHEPKLEFVGTSCS